MLRIINEPAAAALAYGEGRVVAVCKDTGEKRRDVFVVCGRGSRSAVH